MDKIKVSREVFEALESTKNWADRDNSLIRHAFNKSFKCKREVLNHITTIDIAKMVLFGYEVKETPEERLAILYNSPPKYLTMGRDKYASAAIEKSYREGIEIALKLMEIEVKGIHT